MIQDIHEEVKARIAKQNLKHAIRANRTKRERLFQVGDWVYARLHHRGQIVNKLTPKAEGPFRIARTIGPNAYELDLEGKFAVSNVFNVTDLIPFVQDDHENPTKDSSKGGGDGVGPQANHEEEATSNEEPTGGRGLLIDRGEFNLIWEQSSPAVAKDTTITASDAPRSPSHDFVNEHQQHQGTARVDRFLSKTVLIARACMDGFVHETDASNSPREPVVPARSLREKPPARARANSFSARANVDRQALHILDSHQSTCHQPPA